MVEFKDILGNMVRLEFKENAFSVPPEHVLVISRYKDKWLLTKHKKRGLEFPGGKVEMDETIEEAALREVFEETGAHLKSLFFIGEYEVRDKDRFFVKAIFYGEAEALEEKESYLETGGPVLIGGDILRLRYDSPYSFIMKDSIVEKSILYIRDYLGKGNR